MVDIYDLIKAERDRQDRLWGGEEHDRQHPITDWIEWIKNYADEAATDPKALIKVAALAIAAFGVYPVNL